jgi:hypothetical protein
VALKEGFGLNSSVERISLAPVGRDTHPGQRRGSVSSPTDGSTFYRITDPDKDQHFTLCLDETLSAKDLRALNLSKEDLFICRDAALTDELAANLALQCRLKTL